MHHRQQRGITYPCYFKNTCTANTFSKSSWQCTAQQKAVLLRLQPEEAGPRRLPSWAESPWSVRGQMFRLSRALWEAGATPGAVIRTLGPWGPGLIQKYARSRCAKIHSSQSMFLWCQWLHDVKSSLVSIPAMANHGKLSGSDVSSAESSMVCAEAGKAQTLSHCSSVGRYRGSCKRMRLLCRFREGMGLTSQEVAAFEEYFYHIMAARGSGEHALRHLLAPFARAKHPLEGRLHELKVSLLQSMHSLCLPEIVMPSVSQGCKCV